MTVELVEWCNLGRGSHPAAVSGGLGRVAAHLALPSHYESRAAFKESFGADQVLLILAVVAATAILGRCCSRFQLQVAPAILMEVGAERIILVPREEVGRVPRFAGFAGFAGRGLLNCRTQSLPDCEAPE